MSDVNLSALAGQRGDDDDDDPPILTPQPDSTEELQPISPALLHPGLEVETRPGDLSGESDGLQSLPDGGDVDDQSGRYRFQYGIHCSLTYQAPVAHPAK